MLRAMTVEVTGSDSGVDFVVTLERADLLPGQLASGSVQMTFRGVRKTASGPSAEVSVEAWAPLVASNPRLRAARGAVSLRLAGSLSG